MTEIDAAALGLPESEAELTPLPTIAKSFIDLREQRDMLKSHLADLDAELKSLNEILVKRFVDDDIQALHIDGKALYLHTQTWASAVDGNMPALIEAMKADEETADLVKETVMSQTLSAWVREQDIDPQTMEPVLPEHVRDFVNVTEKTDVRMRTK